VPNFISFASSTAELAHAEKSHNHSLTHSIIHPTYSVYYKTEAKITP